MSSKKKLTFEDSLRRLEEISSILEGGEAGLDDTIKLYEEGIKLSEECYTKLNSAELKVNELKKELRENINKNNG